MSHPGPGAAGHAPQPGRTPGYRVGEGTKTGAAGFINVQGKLFAPLQGLSDNDVLQGGYGFLDVTDGGATFHPGADLNTAGGCDSDLGNEVVAVLGGVIEAVLPWNGASGEGNHLWYRVTSDLAPGPTWVHYDHLGGFAVAEGDVVTAGQLVGWCNKTGGWSCAHLHTELVKGAPPNGYWMWPYGWTREQVEDVYYEPAAWWRAASAKVQGAAPPEVALILSGAQSAVVQAAVWDRYWRPEADTFAIETAWRDEWRRGVWRGAPLSDEQLLPEDATEGKPGGAFRIFEGGVACWLPGQEVSWNG